MFLEKLEIFGFKSIPHKLSLKFGTGITGSSGPDGSPGRPISTVFKVPIRPLRTSSHARRN